MNLNQHSYVILRTCECLKVKVGHVAINAEHTSAVILLPSSKTFDKFDLFESTVINELFLVMWLGHLSKKRQCSDLLLTLTRLASVKSSHELFRFGEPTSGA